MHTYIITNTVNGKYYIGKTVRSDLKKYFKDKIRAAVSEKDIRFGQGRNHLYNAIRKYGAENFTISSLVRLSDNKGLCHLERELIASLKAQDPKIGYNISAGGEGVTGFKWQEESRKKLSRTNTGNQRVLGKKWTKEHKAKTRASLMGHPVSEKTRAKIRAARALQVIAPASEAIKRKMSIAAKAREAKKAK